MPVCTYDNPYTMRRECWQNGALIASASIKMIENRDQVSQPIMFFGLNTGRWKTGKMVGDPEAIRGQSFGENTEKIRRKFRQ